MQDTAKPRKRGRPGYSRADIIRAAEQEFLEHGYAETSVQQISRRLGITKSAIYHHVSSKEQLVELVAGRASDICESIVRFAQEDEDEPIELLKNAVWELTIALCEDPGALRLTLRAHPGDESSQPLRRVRETFTDSLRAMVDACHADGSLHTTPTAAAATDLILTSCATLAQYYRGGDAEDAADVALSFVFQGLREARRERI